METFVYSLRMTKIILNNAHCTHNNCLAVLLEQCLELQKRSYSASLCGIEARARCRTKQTVGLICMAFVY